MIGNVPTPQEWNEACKRILKLENENERLKNALRSIACLLNNRTGRTEAPLRKRAAK